MRILMLTRRLPWPLNAGEKIRVYHTIKELARSHEVTLVCSVFTNEERLGIQAVQAHCAELYPVPGVLKPRMLAALESVLSFRSYHLAKFYNPGCRKLVASLLGTGTYGVVWVHFLEMLSHLPFLITPRPLVILDSHNAEEVMWSQFAESGHWGMRAFSWYNLWKLRRYQQEALRQVDVLLAVSDLDGALLRRRAPALCQVWIAPNGVDVEHFRPLPTTPSERRNVILFCAGMDAQRNIDAAVRFAREIFPRVKKDVPDAEFWIVGRNPTAPVRGLASIPGIKVTGTVEDVRSYYQRAKVVVAPFRYGEGTKLKILEAMAMGVPVVSTTIGIQGIDALPKHHLLVEDENERLAEGVIRLLRDDNLRRLLASASRALVEERYSWTGISDRTLCRLEELV